MQSTVNSHSCGLVRRWIKFVKPPPVVVKDSKLVNTHLSHSSQWFNIHIILCYCSSDEVSGFSTCVHWVCNKMKTSNKAIPVRKANDTTKYTHKTSCRWRKMRCCSNVYWVGDVRVTNVRRCCMLMCYCVATAPSVHSCASCNVIRNIIRYCSRAFYVRSLINFLFIGRRHKRVNDTEWRR